VGPYTVGSRFLGLYQPSLGDANSTEYRRAKALRVLDDQRLFFGVARRLPSTGPLKDLHEPLTTTAATRPSASRQPQFLFGSGATRDRSEHISVRYAKAQAHVHTVEYVFQQPAVKNVA